MKISFHWLKDCVDVALGASEVADLLTHAGLEVESLEEWRPAFQGVVVGRLLSCRPLPQSDHLSLCTVTDGRRDYSVVCGAPNVKAGERVALALEGATLPGDVRIGRSVFQGTVSEGMLCSEKELGLSDEGSGIMFLNSSVPLGAPVDQALQLKDWILDVNVTPNRSDCLCVLGIAREVAALTGGKARLPDVRREEKGAPAEEKTSVLIDRPDLCPRYVAKLIQGVKIAPSPFQVRRRLEAVGIRAISNIVDATNYVMMEMGQPLHAFDFERLEERRIVVRTARPGEIFVTLDGMERRLPEEALMICDGKRPVALAGIMGGLNSEVEPGTTHILLESAYFDPMGIRRTSKRTGLSTEASVRFERGIDPNGSLRAAERAASLMVEWAGGLLARGAVDNYPRKIHPRTIDLRVSRANEILGTGLSAGSVAAYLRSLELDLAPAGEGRFQVSAPTFRVDLEREIDLIEEVARRHGFQRIPVTLPSGRVAAEKETKLQRSTAAGKGLLASFGFWEVITYSFISPRSLEDLQLPPAHLKRQALRIQNPLSEEQSVMRTTLLPGLLEVARSNARRQIIDLKIFETGRVFFPREGQELPEEKEFLSGLLAGMREEESWAKPKAECDFFDLKGILEGLFDGLGVAGVEFLPETGEPFLHPGAACRIAAQGAVLGLMGEMHPAMREIFELKQKVFLFELDFAAVVAGIRGGRSFKALPRFPAATRDLAVIVAEDVPAGALLRALQETSKDWVAEIRLFDLYQGQPIPPGKKSLAFRLKYQREDRTLTDREVNEIHQQLMDLLAERFGAVLR